MADNMQDRGAHVGSEAGAAAEQASGTMSEMAGRAREVAGEYADQARDYAQQGYRYAADKAGQLKNTTENYIVENPWYAIGIALGAGVLLGMLLKTGSRRD